MAREHNFAIVPALKEKKVGKEDKVRIIFKFAAFLKLAFNNYIEERRMLGGSVSFQYFSAHSDLMVSSYWITSICNKCVKK